MELELSALHRSAREIFDRALESLDAGAAVRRAVTLEGPRLKIFDTTLDLVEGRTGIYAIAIGKAALPMAAALTETLGERLTAGIIAAPVQDADWKTTGIDSQISNQQSSILNPLLSGRWRLFKGGHPLPNLESLEAARAAFELLRRADREGAPLIFLISGGGSAAIEWPRDERITLEELRAANLALISCGARITEINAVRRAVSAVKGGGLARSAPNCAQVSLIISDTNPGEEATVASGPTFDSQGRAEGDPSEIIARYKLEAALPESILRAVEQFSSTERREDHRALRRHYVLLDNESALNRAAEAARARGLTVEIARDILEQEVSAGCTLLLSRLLELHGRESDEGRGVCLISGGEFACPVRGQGLGGRNAESALRWAIELDALAANRSISSHVVALSAGTDGVDGNSTAAGAASDETTVRRARSLGLDARRFLDESDAHTFFDALGDALVTGPTGTNVRDLRILIAG
ncbi:MAG TPA: DUF4147 domain-containing protein [Pyrinomonadaceae bacterium]